MPLREFYEKENCFNTFVDLKDTHNVFWVRNTENEHDFCSFPQGDFKVKRNASAYKFSEEYQSCAKLFVVTYKSDKLPQVFSRHHLGLKTNKICVCGVKRSELTRPAEG